MHCASSVDIFFSLLRSGLYGVPLPEHELPDTIDWADIGRLANMQTVRGIILESLQFLPEHLLPPKDLQQKMRVVASKMILSEMTINKALAEVVGTLDGEGIKSVLLKGQGVAQYYRIPQIRQVGDIDLYVGKKAYKQAVDTCQRLLVEDKLTISETNLHFDFLLGEVTVEIHRLASRIYSPVRRKRFQCWVEEQLERSANRRTLTVEGVDVMLPPLEFDAFYIFYHAWLHFSSGGIGLRHLCDWTMIFHNHSGEIDKERLIANIRRFGVANGWKLFACIAVNHLGLDRDKMPMYDPAFTAKSEKALADILDGGNFGFYSEAYTSLPESQSSFAYIWIKVRNAGGYFISLFPLMPIEATFLFFNRLGEGAKVVAQRLLKRKS